MRRVRSIRRDLERIVRQTSLIVVLLGAGGRGLEERRRIARVLSARKIIAIVPEDDLPCDLGPSLAEKEVLARSDVDLVFLNVESWGAATELGQLHEDRRVAPKLRVLVRPEHHPIYSPDDGYLRDLYLTHLVAFGHVYAVDGGRTVVVPSALDLISLFTERHRRVHAFESTNTK